MTHAFLSFVTFDTSISIETEILTVMLKLNTQEENKLVKLVDIVFPLTYNLIILGLHRFDPLTSLNNPAKRYHLARRRIFSVTNRTLYIHNRCYRPFSALII